jgi:hypothetical protein
VFVDPVKMPLFLLSALPRGGPHIQGYQRVVSLGEDIVLNCTSLKSKPAAKLEFFINNKKASNLSLNEPKVS